MRISDWSSDVCSSDLREDARTAGALRVEYGARRRRTATRDEGIGVVDLGDIPCTPDREGQPARRRRLQLGFDTMALGVDVEQARDIRGAADRGQLQILGVEIIAGQVEADAVVEERGLDPRFIRHRFLLKIGRASCRERVCQYV